MPMIGGGDDTTAMLLRFISERNATRRDQAINLINSLKPGETLASLGPGNTGVKAFKRATGAKADPNRVVKPHTAETLMDEEQVLALAGLSPGIKKGLAINQIINKAQSTSGRQTEAGFEATGREQTAVTGARATVAEAGQRSIESKAPAELAAAGETMALGETAGTSRAKDVAAKTSEMTNTYAQGFLADPANTEWGAMLKEAGLDPIGVTQAFATGQESALSGILHIKAIEATNAGDLTNKLEEARIRVAEAIAKETGNRLPVRTQLVLENAVESGNNPFEAGVDPQTVGLWITSRELQIGGVLRTALAKENPQAKLVEQMLANLKNFGDVNQLSAANNVAATLTAQLLTELDMGPRPGPDDLERQKVWDTRAKYHFGTLGLIGKTPGTLFGKDLGPFTQDQVGTVQNPAFMQGTAVDTTSGTTTPAGPTGRTGASKNGAPTFMDPSAAAAVGGALNMGRDSTFRRQPGAGRRAPARPTPLKPEAAARQTPPPPTETIVQAITRISQTAKTDEEIDAELTKLEAARGPDFRDRVATAFEEPAQ